MVEHDFNIASRMEAKPALPSLYCHLKSSEKGWWILGPLPAGGMAWFPNHTWCEVYRAAATDAQKRISELEAQLKGWNKAFQSTDPAIAAERMQNAIDFAKFVGYEDARARYDAKLKAAREALEIARQETRIAAVMLDQVEPSAAITVKESDRLHLAANKMRTVSDLSDKALAALDGEKKGDIDERN